MKAQRGRLRVERGRRRMRPNKVLLPCAVVVDVSGAAVNRLAAERLGTGGVTA